MGVVQPTRGTYSNTTVKLVGCNNYAILNFGGAALLISNVQGDGSAVSTTIPAGGSYSSPAQGSYNIEYGDIFINGESTDFTIECSPGTEATEV